MNPQLAKLITWGINSYPVEDATMLRQGRQQPISRDVWQQVILPGRNFSIIYPFARYGELDPTIPYEAQGMPVTLEDLLTTIYEFYQEPIPNEEKEILKKEDPQFYGGLDILQPGIPHKRVHAMDELIFFEGLLEEGPNTYRLILGS